MLLARVVWAPAIASAVAAALALSALSSACSSSPAKVGAQPSWRTAPGTLANATVFNPTAPAAAQYNQPAGPLPSTPLGDATLAMVAQVASQKGLAAPTADPRLFEACAELAAVVPQDSLLQYSLVEFALQRHGIIEPSPHLLVVWGTIDQVGPVIDQLMASVDQILTPGGWRVGIGAAKRMPDGTGAVVFALQQTHITASPMPRELPNGGVVHINAGVAAGFTDPDVIVTSVNGDTKRVPLTGNASKFSATVECGAQRGRIQVEVTASDATGSTVLANFPVWCNEAAPTALALDGEREAPLNSPSDAEQRMLGLLNQDRRRAGLHDLVWDERVADVARKYSVEMEQTGNVGHISPISGSAADRIKVANIKTAAVMENVARGYGAREAHIGLMNSPGHRANLLSPLATHVGIGVVFRSNQDGPRDLFVTQLFTRVPPKVDLPTTASHVFAMLRAARPAVVRNAALDSRAQQLAERLAAGQSKDQAWPVISRDLDRVSAPFARFGTAAVAVGDLESASANDLLPTGMVTHEVGVGVGQGTHPDFGDNALWLVVIAAQRR